MRLWKFSFAIALIGLMCEASAQQAHIKKENRQGRLEHEHNMYKNPATGKIPANIRQSELTFTKSQKAGLDASLRTKPNGRSMESTQQWDQRGPYNQGGRTKAIGVDSRNSNIILAGGTSGGMFRTTDGGANWVLVSNSLDNPSITGVAQSPISQDTWYYITGEAKESVNTNQGFQQYIGDGVFKSIDNGVTWAQLANTAPENAVLFGDGARSDWQLCHDIAVDPIDGAVLVANIGGIYRSADAGDTWTKVLDAVGQANFGDVVHLDVAIVAPAGPSPARVYYAGTHSSGDKAGFFRSADGGVTWTSLGGPGNGFSGTWERIRVAVAPSNTNVVWFLASGSSLAPSNTQLLKCVYSAVTVPTWTDRTANLPDLAGSVGNFNTQGSYNMVMKVKPDDEDYIFIGDTKLWRSSDGFATKAIAANTGNTQWIGGYSPDNNISTYPNHHPDVHELVFLPGSNTEALSGHDGGLSITTDITANNGVPSGYSSPHPVTWSILNNGLYTTQAYAISIDPTTENSAAILAGFQDNGNFGTDDISGTANWAQQPHGGDGSWNAIASGGETWYISQQYGTVERLSDGQASGHGVNPSGYGSSGTNTFISPFILDRNDDDIMYYAANETDENGGKKELWRNNTISTVNVGGHPFQGTSTGWTNLNFGGTTLTGDITAMETSVSPANVLYIGTSAGEVYRIADAHTGSTVTVTDIFTGKGLSSGFISSIDVDPDNADHVYITFSNYEVISIYKSTDAGATWSDISGNLEENVDGSGAGPAIRWIHVFKKKDNTNVYLVGATTGLYSTSTLIADEVVTINPSVVFEIGVGYYVEIEASAFEDLGRNNFAGISDKTVWNFTANTETPIIISSIPTDDAIDVDPADDLTITFSENVVDAGGSVIIKKDTDDSVVESMLVSSANISIADAVVTINPTSVLEIATAYYVEIEASAFMDEGGSKFAGIADKTTWNFTTTTVAGVNDRLPENRMKITVLDGGINLSFLGKTIKYAEINVFGMDGKKATYTARTSFKNNNVNIKAMLSPGVYVVKASTDEGLYTQKFLISE